MKSKLHIVVCSTRPNRVGSSVARWALEEAEAQGHFDAELVELASFELPVFDEPEHPRLQKYQHAHTKNWSASVDAADAFLFVLPEYNFGAPGALVNAMQYLSREWQYKAVGLVSYGGISGGMRSAQAVRNMVTVYKMVPLLEAVPVVNVFQQLDADKAFVPNEANTTSAKAMLDELGRWTGALKTLRAPA
ncbi:MAG: NADPH-dependent FMN reductase [Pigmentiphaga sp.]